MANVFDYITWRGDITMLQDGLNEVDALIFSRLAYLPFDGIVNEDLSVSVSLQDAAEKVAFSNYTAPYKYLDDDEKLLNTISKAPRYKDIKISGYIHLVDQQAEEQFSAIVFRITENLAFVAFRGTDTSIVGWKENFNMSFMAPVPAQKDSVRYLEKVAESLPCHLAIGGHSKGGNLAVYSAVFCSQTTQDRIVAVYNNDGPGFNADLITEQGFIHLKDKIHTFVPQSSVVGMLMERREPYITIKSTESSLYQHNLYSWEIQGGHFVYVDDTTDGSKFVDQTIKSWLRQMDKNQLEEFVEAIFGILEDTEVTNTNEFSENWYASAKALAKSLYNTDPSAQQALSQAFDLLFKSAQNILMSDK